ncbi:hypothetical protein Y032_0020g72 [Ancylostoma ceylanicum]|uniref:Uncharacterized protein n=1 Tax=Ancylostoma ceylanicum TaxID=53326 RepID=A0A016V2J5_9BILA|nr:hypothetical protein Y032_0020g72 [Ancylostoma ceylanicum]
MRTPTHTIREKEKSAIVPGSRSAIAFRAKLRHSNREQVSEKKLCYLVPLSWMYSVDETCTLPIPYSWIPTLLFDANNSLLPHK